jgi:hypothetical protein
MDHDHSGAALIGIFMAVGTVLWVIPSGDQKPKAETPQRLTPLPREKLPRSFEMLPTASERFGRD